MADDRLDPEGAQQSAQVLRFRLRRRADGPPAPDRAGEPLDDLAQYEQEQYEDEDDNADYRHRMLMNAIAVAVVAILVGVGVLIADTIAEIERDQDCVLQGRSNCAPIEVPAPKG